MPASNLRARQPVTELTEALGKIVKLPVFENLLSKKRNGKQLKNLTSKAEKVAALQDNFSINDQISVDGGGQICGGARGNAFRVFGTGGVGDDGAGLKWHLRQEPLQ